MSAAFRAHREVLPAAQQALWPWLKPITERGFVLYGGTAIALRLGHRSSVDFDFFAAQPLESDGLRKVAPILDRATTLQATADTLTVLAPSATREEVGVKLSFFGAIDFGRVGTPAYTQDGTLLVASLDDLMATKLKVILQRLESKDYHDIAAMIEAGVSLSAGLAAASRLFGGAFQPAESLKALTWFEGGDLDILSKPIRETLIRTAGKVHDLPVVRLVSTRLAIEPTD
jgi:hypothetical protein